MAKATRLDQMWSKVRKTETCWLWTAGTNGVGYGMFWWEGRKRLVHRLAYEALVGPIPAGQELDHLCRNPPCCNPAHLEPVTHAENLLRSPVAPTTINAIKTHCDQGHPFDETNTYITSRGYRQCRICNAARARLGRKRAKFRAR